MKTKISKILFTICFIATAVFIFSCGKENKTGTQDSQPGADKNSPKEFKETENFIVSYDLEGIIKGKMDILRSGAKFKQKINTQIMGIKNISTIYILDKVVYNLMEGAGQKFTTKTGLDEYNSMKQTGETITDFKEFEKFLNGKKITGKETIIGYNCDVYDLGNDVSISVLNKKYILKIKNSEFMAVANLVNTNPTFEADEFTLPADVDFNSSSTKDISKKTIDSVMQKLKK